MTGLKQRISRRRPAGPPGPGDEGPAPRPKAGLRVPGLGRKRLAWGKRAEAPAPQVAEAGVPAELVDAPPGSASFRDRGRMRRRLRFLRRARELAFRDVGGLIFDLRRFGRDRPDLVEAKLNALTAVDRELRGLERVLDDHRPIYELREPGLSSCQRCGALHSSEDNFCPRCGLQFGGSLAMGEVGGAIAAPPQAPPIPARQPPPSLLTPTPPEARGGGAPPRPDPPADEQQTRIYRPPDAS